jgi:hypothetical protein
MENTETKVSEWRECINGPWYPSLHHGGFVKYRIWQAYDGLRWFQRHEWTHADGTQELEGWIKGAEGWLDSAKVAT